MTEPTIVKIRHQLPDAFTTADIRAKSNQHGIDDERAVIDWLIDHKHIKRVKVGHYQKCKRYRGEK